MQTDNNLQVASEEFLHFPNVKTFSETLLPTPNDNSVITAIKTLGLYKKSLGLGKHDITCPWVAEHTKGRDSGTAYFEPNGKFYAGGFKCQHSHCKRRTLKDLLAYLEISFSEVIAGAK